MFCKTGIIFGDDERGLWRIKVRVTVYTAAVPGNRV